MHKYPRSTGFTLLEILMALFIFSIIAVIAATALHTAIMTRNGTMAYSNRLAQMQTAMMFFNRDVAQIVDRPIAIPAGKKLPAVMANITPQTYLEFTRGGVDNPAAKQKRSTLQRVAYYVKKGTLTRVEWQVLDRTNNTQPITRPLLHHVTAFSFQILTPKGQWVNTWPSYNQSAQFPQGIKLHICVKKWGCLSRIYALTGSAWHA